MGSLLFCPGTSSLLLLGTVMRSVELNRTEGPFGFWSGLAFLQVKSCCRQAGRQAGLEGRAHPALYSPPQWNLQVRHGMRECPSGDRTARSRRPAATGPVGQHLLPPAPLGFLLQWTLGAIVCCDPKLTGKESVSLTPHPLCAPVWGVGYSHLVTDTAFGLGLKLWRSFDVKTG